MARVVPVHQSFGVRLRKPDAERGMPNLPTRVTTSWLRVSNFSCAQFVDRKFTCLSPLPSGPSYTSTAVMEGKVCPVIGALPGEPVVEGSRYLARKYQYYPSHLWRSAFSEDRIVPLWHLGAFGLTTSQFRNLAIEFGLMVAFCIIHVLASQYILAERSKGDLLVFKDQHKIVQRHPSSGPEDGPKMTPLTFAQDVNKLQSHHSNTLDQMMVLTGQKNSVAFEWNSLCYDVATKHGTKRILNQVTGWVKPGSMTALMVSSSVCCDSSYNAMFIILNSDDRLSSLELTTNNCRA